MENSQLKSNIPNNNAIAYLRVSTKKQEEEGNSIEIQRKLALKYAKEQKLNIIEFLEEAQSASKISNPNLDISLNLYDSLDNRPELQKVLKLAKDKKIQHLIVFSRDRLARNLELSLALDYFFNKTNIKVHYTRPGEIVSTDDTKISKFLKMVFASISELEANLISSRVKGGLTETVRSGYWPGGSPPYGYVLRKINKKNSILHPSLLEVNDVKKIFNLYTNYGYSYRKIADILNTDNNCNIWTKGKIEAILKNETYTGCINWNRRSRTPDSDSTCVRSKYTELSSIINDEQWGETLKLRQTKSGIKDHKYYSTPFLLRDKLVCSVCNTIMKAKNYGNDREGIYRCSNKNNGKSELIIKKNIIENKFINELSKILSNHNADILWTNYEINAQREKENNEEKIICLDKDIENKKNLLSKLDELLNQHINNASSINSKKNKEKNIDSSDNEVLEKEYSIKNIIFNESIQLQKEIQSLKDQKEILKNLDSKYFKSQIELKNHIEKFFECDFNKLEQERKRILVDILIDKVVLYKNDNDIDIKIYVNKIE